MPTIYMVSGFMRSGTSMMMRCLEAGGMDAVYNPDRDTVNVEKWSDENYHPNSGGFYELLAPEYRDPELLKRCEGKVVKCLRKGPLNMDNPDYNFKVIVMRRDGEEIRQSAQAIFQTDTDANYGVRANKLITRVVRELEKKPNWDVTQVMYRAVVEGPLAQFKRLESYGWPILTDRAASVVDADLCRFRREELDVGV